MTFEKVVYDIAVVDQVHLVGIDGKLLTVYKILDYPADEIVVRYRLNKRIVEVRGEHYPLGFALDAVHFRLSVRCEHEPELEKQIVADRAVGTVLEYDYRLITALYLPDDCIADGRKTRAVVGIAADKAPVIVF